MARTARPKIPNWSSNRGANSITARLRRAIETGVYARWRPVAAGAPARGRLRDRALDHPQGARPARTEGLRGAARRIGTFVNYSGPVQDSMADVTDLISPLQLIETRFAIEPYMTRLADPACLGARSRCDAGVFSSSSKRSANDQDALHAARFGVSPAARRCSRNPLIYRLYQQINTVRAHAQWEQMKQIILSSEKMAHLQPAAPRHLRGAAPARCAEVRSIRSSGISRRRARTCSARTASDLIMHPVLLGTLAAALLGNAGFSGGWSSRRLGYMRTTAGVTLTGFVALTLALAIFGTFPAIEGSQAWIAMAAGAGIALATLCLFAALASGPISLAIPVAMSYPASTVLVFAASARFPPCLNLWRSRRSSAARLSSRLTRMPIAMISGRVASGAH